MLLSLNCHFSKISLITEATTEQYLNISYFLILFFIIIAEDEIYLPSNMEKDGMEPVAEV